MIEHKEWKLVRVYECPDCGQLVRDRDAACKHKCSKAKVSEETIEKLELLKTIFDLKRALKATAWYKPQERRNIKHKILLLDSKRVYS